MTAQDPGPAPSRRPARLDPRTRVMVVAGVLLVLLLVVVQRMPVPYVIEAPGPVVDTLGQSEGEPIVQIDGAPTYPTTGRLDLTTVSVFGGPGREVSLLQVLQGWWSASEAVAPTELVFPEGATAEDVEAENAAEQASSQELAAVAALRQLGQDVPERLTVADPDAAQDPTAPGGPSGVEGVQSGDVLVAVDGQDVTSLEGLQQELAAVGGGVEVQVTVERAGAQVQVPVTTQAGDDGAVRLGVAVVPDYDVPVDVTITARSADGSAIGGPSAGTMYALAIIDLLTEDDLTGGEHVAGTGTIGADGAVGAIGGIQQKLVGARDDGATWFLAPASNCPDVVGNVPDGLNVLAVSTLAEAVDAVTAVADGAAEDLPTCTSAS